MWLRELHEPLTTFDVYSLAATTGDLSESVQDVLVRKLLQRIPDTNRIVLKVAQTLVCLRARVCAVCVYVCAVCAVCA
jgi:hypothetical protein